MGSEMCIRDRHNSRRCGIQCASAVPTTVLSERSQTLHFASQSAPRPSILHPKRLPDSPFCTLNGAFPLHFAPQSAQMPILIVFEAIPGQSGVQNCSLFGQMSDFFVFFLEKMRPLQNMRRHERIACAALPRSSIFAHFEFKKRPKMRAKKGTLKSHASLA